MTDKQAHILLVRKRFTPEHIKYTYKKTELLTVQLGVRKLRYHSIIPPISALRRLNSCIGLPLQFLNHAAMSRWLCNSKSSHPPVQILIPLDRSPMWFYNQVEKLFIFIYMEIPQYQTFFHNDSTYFSIFRYLQHWIEVSLILTIIKNKSGRWPNDWR